MGWGPVRPGLGAEGSTAGLGLGSGQESGWIGGGGPAPQASGSGGRRCPEGPCAKGVGRRAGALAWAGGQGGEKQRRNFQIAEEGAAPSANSSHLEGSAVWVPASARPLGSCAVPRLEWSSRPRTPPSPAVRPREGASRDLLGRHGPWASLGPEEVPACGCSPGLRTPRVWTARPDVTPAHAPWVCAEQDLQPQAARPAPRTNPGQRPRPGNAIVRRGRLCLTTDLLNKLENKCLTLSQSKYCPWSRSKLVPIWVLGSAEAGGVGRHPGRWEPGTQVNTGKVQTSGAAGGARLGPPRGRGEGGARLGPQPLGVWRLGSWGLGQPLHGGARRASLRPSAQPPGRKGAPGKTGSFSRASPGVWMQSASPQNDFGE